MTAPPGRRGARRYRLGPVLLAVAAACPAVMLPATATPALAAVVPRSPAATPAPAAAPATTPAAPEPAQVTGGLRLVSQTPAVDPDGTFSARIDISSLAPVGTMSVDISVYSVLNDETGLYKGPTPAARLRPLPTKKLSAFPVDTNGVLTLDVPVRSGDPQNPDRTYLPDPGVYPVVVSISNGANVVGTIRLDLVRLPQPAAATAARRSVAPTLAVGGAGGLSLPDATDLLRRHPRAPVTVLLGRAVLSQLDANPSATRDAFVAAVRARPVVATMSPDLDPSALAAIDQGDLYRDAVQATTAQLQRLGLTPLPRAVITTAPLTAEGAELIASMASLAIPLPGSAADPATANAAAPGGAGATGSGAGTPTTGNPTTGTSPGASGPGRAATSWVRTIATSTGPLTVAHLDPGPGPQVSGETRGSTQAAYRQLARVMLRNPKAPPLLLGGFAANPAAPNGAAWSDPTFLDLLLGVIDQTAAGSPAGTPLTALTFIDATLNPTGTIEPAAGPSQDLSGVVDGLTKAESLLATYTGFHADGPPSPANYRARLNQALSLDQADDGRARIIDQINFELNRSFDLISIPDGQSVTMAARRADIPLTVQNDADGARYVRLVLSSDSKLQVVDPDRVIRIEPGANSIDVTVQARSLGESPLRVSVLTPDRRPLYTTRYQVRSTSFPGLGVLITAVVLAALGVWWYFGVRRKGPAGRRPHGAPGAETQGGAARGPDLLVRPDPAAGAGEGPPTPPPVPAAVPAGAGTPVASAGSPGPVVTNGAPTAVGAGDRSAVLATDSVDL